MARRTDKNAATARMKQQREDLLKFLKSSERVRGTEGLEEATDSANWVRAMRKKSDARLETVKSSFSNKA